MDLDLFIEWVLMLVVFLRMASLHALIAKFLAFACSLNLTMITFLTNQRAALDESGMVLLPCTWILRVEWWR